MDILLQARRNVFRISRRQVLKLNSFGYFTVQFLRRHSPHRRPMAGTRAANPSKTTMKVAKAVGVPASVGTAYALGKNIAQ